MRRCLVEKLACPECRGDIKIATVHEENSIRILRGILQCVSCSKRYAIERGVPRLVKATDDVAEVGKRFSFQWQSRWNGKFEGERCYGFDDEIYIGWVKEQLECRRVPNPGDWILDAGCGSGEKARVLASKCPDQNVIGLDLGVESLEKATEKFGSLANLDYVQGNIMEPPFKDHQFDAGVSIGMLHHTNDTRQAFAKFRKLLKDETTCVIWIYPTYREGPEWCLPYLARDFLTLRQGFRLPTQLLRMMAHSIVLIFYPLVQIFFWLSYRRMGRDLPFFRVDSMSLRERYAAQVFHCFDTLLPRYQWRHRIEEVESWFPEEGLERVHYAHSFYTASKHRAAPATSQSINAAPEMPAKSKF